MTSEDMANKYVKALFDTLMNQAKDFMSDKDFQKYIEKYFKNPNLELVFSRKDGKGKIRYSEIIKIFIRAYGIVQN